MGLLPSNPELPWPSVHRFACRSSGPRTSSRVFCMRSRWLASSWPMPADTQLAVAGSPPNSNRPRPRSPCFGKSLASRMAAGSGRGPGEDPITHRLSACDSSNFGRLVGGIWRRRHTFSCSTCTRCSCGCVASTSRASEPSSKPSSPSTAIRISSGISCGN